MRDTLTKSGAMRIRNKIKEYWLNRGYYVEAWIERIPDTNNLYQVRTDLVDGLPRPEQQIKTTTQYLKV